MSRRHGEKARPEAELSVKAVAPNRMILSPRGHVTISGDISGCCSSWVKARGCCAQDGPQDRGLSGPKCQQL